LGDNATAENQISEWFSQFKYNDTSVEDCVHSGGSLENRQRTDEATFQRLLKS
jgi:hypothetical protein